MINGFENARNYQKMPERPDSWFNEPDSSEMDEPLEELEVIEDDDDDDDDDKAWQEYKNEFYKYERQHNE